jgi:hypothetical protein
MRCLGRASTKADLRSENLDLQHFQHGVVALEHPLRLADGQPVVVRAKWLGGLPTSRRKAVLKALADW